MVREDTESLKLCIFNGCSRTLRLNASKKEKLPQTIENSNFLESLKEKYCFAEKNCIVVEPL